MKKATSAFPIDNGTVAEGQVLPDSHPAVVRYPDKFTDVLGDVSSDDGTVTVEAAPNGLNTNGVGETVVVDQPVVVDESASADAAADDKAKPSPKTST